ncbi:osteopontin [Taeniopygia guttata]|uniref:osteopontin n=1 Tax=Taeniopygia guttata TaxID=59729 RepID=UPI003BB94951
MKVAVLCLCLISITAAWPVVPSKQHAISASSEEKYDSRGQHLHRYHNDHVNSQSQESQQHPQSDLASSQQTLYSSEESMDVQEQLHFPDVSSKSHEDVDDDDDNDSNDTDESEEVVTSFPTDIPVTEPFPTVPFTRGDNAGRGDSVAYRMRAKAALLKYIKFHKDAKKLLYDATEEDESDMDAASQRSLSRENPAFRRSKPASSVVWSDQSHGRDSSEQDSDPHHRSLENLSWPKSDSHEAQGDRSKSGVRKDSLSSVESRERGDSHPSVESRETGDSHPSVESRERGDSHPSVESRERGDSHSSVESRETGDSHPSVESRERGDSHSSVESRETGDSHPSVESRERGDSHSSVESREIGDSHPSVESRESPDRVSAELADGISSQTLESAEDSQDRHSIESNEVTL